MAAIAKVAQCGRLHVPEVVGVCLVQRRSKSTSLSQTNYKRGTGGRSSFSGIVATVFGANSLLGPMVVNRLGKIGSQVIIPYRGDPYDVKDLQLCGDLGQMLFNKFHLKDEESLRKCMQYSNVVINLIGKDNETRNFSFEDVNVTGARNIARIAKECGVERLIHVSALMAGQESNNVIRDGSQFLATKMEGEKAVREEFPEATILRPADMIGQTDRFIMYYNNDWRLNKAVALSRSPILRFMPLWKGGRQTVKMPIKASDVTSGIMSAVRDPETAGKTYQCAGPSAYTLRDLVEYIHRCKRTTNLQMVDYIFSMKMKARACETWYKIVGVPQPYISLDKLERETVSDVLDPNLPTLEDLGVTPDNIEDYVQFLLRPWMNAKYYKETLGEIPKPSKPVPVSTNILS